MRPTRGKYIYFAQVATYCETRSGSSSIARFVTWKDRLISSLPLFFASFDLSQSLVSIHHHPPVVNMLLIKVALVASSFVIFTTAQDADAGSKGLTPGRGRTPNPSVSGKLMTKRDLTKRCEGTCVACFGAGYTECPNSDLYCYLPGDSTYGLNSCYGDGSSSGDTTATASAPSSTSTGTAGADDICQQKGSTCVSCFGPTYLQCPDGYHCYDPNDPKYDTCPDGSSSSSGGSSSGGGGSNTTATSCANLYGVEHIPCGTDACYDPDKGESCCAEGCKSHRPNPPHMQRRMTTENMTSH